MMMRLGIAILGYLLGAIPFGVIISRGIYKTDIRNQGSGNTGATNVWRVLGAVPGVITLLLDLLKGTIAVVAARFLFPQEPATAMLAGFMAIIGHNWSIFLRGKGGKGVATSAGVFLGLLPLATMTALAVFGLTFFLTRYVSVSSLTASLALVIFVSLVTTPYLLRLLVAVAAILIFIRHIPNIKRLIQGQELKVKL